MNIELISDAESFKALRGEWNDLLSRSAADTIFLTWEWLSSWWDSYATTADKLHIIVVREDSGEAIGIFPLCRRDQAWLPLIPIKQLRFIGDGSWDSDYLDAILFEGRELEILKAVWTWLLGRSGSWDLLQLTGIPETSPFFQWLQRQAGNRHVVSRSTDVPCLVIDLPESWEQYVGSLKPRFRTKVRSTLRDVTTNHQIRFYTVSNEAELKAGLEALYDLHGKRWETKGSEGVFRNPAKRRFYDHFTRQFLAQGWLAFDFLELDGNSVACQMCFRYRGTQFLLQEGFDPQFADESVGIALRAMVLKSAIESGVRRYDFLAGEGRHKTQWQGSAKKCQTIALGPNKIRNTIYLRLPLVMESLRERLKPLLPAKVLEIRRRLAEL